MDEAELSKERLLPWWLWMLAVLAVVIVGSAVWHAASIGRERSEQVRVTAVETVPYIDRHQEYRGYDIPTPPAELVFQEPSAPTENVAEEIEVQPPLETPVPQNPPEEPTGQQAASNPRDDNIGVSDELREVLPGRSIIPPQVTHQVQEPEPEEPTIRYHGREWKAVESDPVTEEQAELAQVGTTDDGRKVYGLEGVEGERKVVFKETETGSGEFRIYRPEG